MGLVLGVPDAFEEAQGSQHREQGVHSPIACRMEPRMTVDFQGEMGGLVRWDGFHQEQEGAELVCMAFLSRLWSQRGQEVTRS